MKKLLIAALALSIGSCMTVTFAADAKTSEAKTLEQVHGAMWPKSKDGYVTKYQCMQCHGDYEKLGQQTADLSPNPHKSHLGQVNCEDCHKADKAKPVLMCNQCHNFTIKKITPEAKK